ncbi:ABC transporter permease subunit [Robbsia sp. Bb-Pol-6]|uniref:ABC transporter permease subunit n=1 Tax=Robbsia betulipollinis TaxID=2981849 RepID=A0ABT3ZUC4_9BURK|nr:ABC transporter permease subunit [Robbsia betulipollinis]MCY0389495.1 ABC transporter permease subunit [Robbsia betulipollinis]
MHFDIHALDGQWGGLARGFVDTLWLCLLGGTMAGVLGIVLLAGQRRGGTFLARLLRLYTDITLALPLLVVLYVAFFVLPAFGVLLPARLVGTLTLAVYYAPYIAEVIRAAVAAVPAGTVEAGTAIGMSPWAIGWRIVTPQALPLLLPTLTGLAIGLLKDSALLSIISVHEFMFAAKEAVSETYAPLEVYLVVALVYWAATATLHAASRHWEKRLGRTAAPLPALSR